jgi:hypothetical protein
MAPTAHRPGKRGVAAVTKRTIAGRSDLLCEVPGCGRVATHRAHVHPHARGSGREARDLWNACAVHHAMYDKAQTLRIVGWTDEGKPVFVFADGRPVLARPADRRPERAPPGGEPGSGKRRDRRRADGRPGDGTEGRGTRAPSK